MSVGSGFDIFGQGKAMHVQIALQQRQSHQGLKAVTSNEHHSM